VCAVCVLCALCVLWVGVWSLGCASALLHAWLRVFTDHLHASNLSNPTPPNPTECATPPSLHPKVGPANDLRLRSLLDLVDQIIYEPCYDTLRTKQQVG